MSPEKPILLVEDDPDTRYAIARHLEKVGHGVVTAHDARDAIEKSQQTRPTLLITDWNLEDGVGGVELAKILTNAIPNLPVIIITGLNTQSIKKELAALNVLEIVHKPAEMQTIKAAVVRALANP